MKINDIDPGRFDAFGRRSTAAINGQTTSTLYDGWNPVQLQASGVAVENRLIGLGLDTNFARTRGGVTESYLTDALGSTLELRNAAQNQTVEYTYDPYGGTASSAASTNMIKYTGREQDLEDLYYYRNRYYKPSVGRFISEDPIGLRGGRNLYTYVRNNPLRYTDSFGQFAIAAPFVLPALDYIGTAILGTGIGVGIYNSINTGAKDAEPQTTESDINEWIYGPENDPKITPDGGTNPNTWTTPDDYSTPEEAQDKLDSFKPCTGRRPVTIPKGTSIKTGTTPGNEGPYNGSGGANETLVPDGLPPGSAGPWSPL